VVVEAGHRSGAKITAHHAAEYGRRVLAVPGLPGWESFAGCLDLIEEGAEVCRGPGSVVVRGPR
jgi:DNA processing protein